MKFTGGKASEPPAGKKRPYCPWTSRLPECVRPALCLSGLSSENGNFRVWIDSHLLFASLAKIFLDSRVVVHEGLGFGNMSV